MGKLVWGCRYAISWCDPDLTFNLAIVTLTLKICPSYISETVICRKLILVGHWSEGVGLQHRITLFVLKVSCSLYCVISSISHGVENYFPGVYTSTMLFSHFISFQVCIVDYVYERKH